MKCVLVHAADLHLDSPLRGFARQEGVAADALRNATRAAFRNLIDLCLTRKAHFLLLAGDLFDGSWRDFSTGLFFVKELERLRTLGTRVLIVRGNHDAESTIQKTLPYPNFVHQFGASAPSSETFSEFDLTVVGQSFAERDVTADLAAQYPKKRGSGLTIGLLHTALEGREGHANYAPTTTRTLRDKGYDYWALGHVHTREHTLHPETQIAFPGNLQGRNIRETGPKGALVIEVDDGALNVEFCALDVARFHVLDLTSAADDDLEALSQRFARAVDGLYADGGPNVRIVRLLLTNQTGALRHGMDQLRAELCASAIARDLLLEKVRLVPSSNEKKGSLSSSVEAATPLLAWGQFAADEPTCALLRDELAGLQAELPDLLHAESEEDELDLFRRAVATANARIEGLP
jgi:DNA repair protein SbcD/Mre11